MLSIITGGGKWVDIIIPVEPASVLAAAEGVALGQWLA